MCLTLMQNSDNPVLHEHCYYSISPYGDPYDSGSMP